MKDTWPPNKSKINRVINKINRQVKEAKKRDLEIHEKLGYTSDNPNWSYGSLSVDLRWDELEVLLWASRFAVKVME